MANKEETKKLCFVIGPIGDVGTESRRHADWLLKGIIKPVFAAHFPEFDVKRADEIVAPGSINAQVIARLLDAPLVIADLSQHNANAFYELAIRHMVRLPTIHMIHKDWKIPFDVASFRAITFSRDNYDDVESAQIRLRSTVEEILKPGFVVETPISHSRGVINLDQHATPDQRVILDKLEALERRLSPSEIPLQAVEIPNDIFPPEFLEDESIRENIASLARFHGLTVTGKTSKGNHFFLLLDSRTAAPERLLSFVESLKKLKEDWSFRELRF